MAKKTNAKKSTPKPKKEIKPVTTKSIKMSDIKADVKVEIEFTKDLPKQKIKKGHKVYALKGTAQALIDLKRAKLTGKTQ